MLTACKECNSPSQEFDGEFCSGACWFTWIATHESMGEYEDPKMEKLREKEARFKKKIEEAVKFAKAIQSGGIDREEDDEDKALAGLTSEGFIMRKKKVVEPIADAVIPAPPKEVNHGERTHSPYSGSKMAYLEKCGDYDSDQSGDKSAANSGTRVHEAVETGDFSKLADQKERDMAEYCIAYRNYLTKQTTKRVDEYEIVFSKHNQKSYVDCLLINGTHGDLLDWKTSMYETEGAETNRQGHCYAVGTFKKYPELDTITVHFVMCKLGKIDAATFTRDQCLRFIEPEIDTIIDEAINKTRPRNAGQHCEWCAHKATCYALLNKALTVVNKYEDSLPVPNEVHSSAITDPKDMAKALALANIMDKWVGSVKKHALELYLSGVPIPGYELAERAGSRKITNAEVAYNALKDHITAEAFIRCTSVSVPELEREFTADAPRGEKAAWKQKMEDALEEADVLEVGAPSKYLKASKSK